MSEIFHIHLVSDSTGETTKSVARACLAQFEGMDSVEHIWPMVLSGDQLATVVEGVAQNPGPVIFTLVSTRASRRLKEECVRLNVPCVSVLDPIMDAFGRYFGRETVNRPGGQHLLDAEYFDRIDALHFVMAHDDGRAPDKLVGADLILVGVSRTSKTPTSVYLANHYGLKTANVPYVRDLPLPRELFDQEDAVIVGLTVSAERLVQIRQHRLLMLEQEPVTDYVDMETVREELREARRIFSSHSWPVIDVTRRSIEETAAAIYQIYVHAHECQEDRP